MAWTKNICERLSRWMVAEMERGSKSYAPQIQYYIKLTELTEEQCATVSQKQAGAVKVAESRELEPAKA